MKILFLTNIPSPYRVKFFNELSKRCELTVAFDSLNAKDRNLNWFKENKIEFNYILLPKLPIRKLFKILNSEYDLIILGVYSTKKAAIARFIMKFKNIKYAISADGGFIGNDNFITKWMKTYFISSASYWLSSSKKTTKYLLYYGAKEKLVFEYPFTSLDDEDILKNIIPYEKRLLERKKIGYNYKKLYISVGSFIKRKGYDILIEAFKDCSSEDDGLLLVGGGPLKSQYEKIIETNNIKNIHLLDFRSKKEIFKLYKLSDVFILPTREDIWGLVINEAMACGLPCISTYSCLAATELLDKKNLYSSENVDELKILLSYFNNRSMKKLELDAVRNLNVIKNYTIENMVSSHISIFKLIINNRRDF